MAQITVMKDDTGKLDGFSDADKRAYRKYAAKIKALEIGELFSFKVSFPRSGPFHRLHMKMIATFFQSQEKFDDEYFFRKWTEIGAGYCLYVPGDDGNMVAIPRSISYDELEQSDYEELHRKTVDFLRGERAQRHLWPHLPRVQSWEMVETVLAGFEMDHELRRAL